MELEQNSSFSNFTASNPCSNARLATAGGEAVHIHGRDFGPVMSLNVIEAAYQNNDLADLAGALYVTRQCEVVIPHALIVCHSVPGVGYDHRWNVTLGSQTSPLSFNTTSYRLPTVDYFDANSTTSLKTNGVRDCTLATAHERKSVLR